MNHFGRFALIRFHDFFALSRTVFFVAAKKRKEKEGKRERRIADAEK